MAYSVPATHKIVSGGPIQFAFDQSASSLTIGEVGQRVQTSDGKEFVLSKYQSSGVAAAAGGPLVFVQTTAAEVVTSDTSDGEADGSSFAGLACVAQANQNNIYIWRQTKGDADDALVASTVAAKDQLYCGASEVFAAIEDNFNSTTSVFYRGVASAKEAAGGTGTSTADIYLY